MEKTSDGVIARMSSLARNITPSSVQQKLLQPEAENEKVLSSRFINNKNNQLIGLLWGKPPLLLHFIIFITNNWQISFFHF